MPGAFKALYNGGRAGEGIQLLGVGGGGGLLFSIQAKEGKHERRQGMSR